MTTPTEDSGLRQVEDQLYGAAPDEFIERRREAVRAAKHDGARELADAIGSLRKPTAAAWAVNSFVRSDDIAVEEVLDIGARLRDAVDRGDGDAIRELMRERTRVIAGVMVAVRRHADQRGEPLSAAVAAQVEQSFRAAMASTDDATLLRRGVLAAALEESGFGAMGANPVSTTRAGPTGEAEDEPTPSGRDRLAAAERRADAAAAVVDDARQELDASTARRTALESERDEVRKRIEDIERALREERDVETATAAQLQDARTELRAARAAVRRAAART